MRVHRGKELVAAEADSRTGDVRAYDGEMHAVDEIDPNSAFRASDLSGRGRLWPQFTSYLKLLTDQSKPQYRRQ